jgi:DNA polymerase (family 10)
MENAQIADLFAEIADLLELRGDNPFRIRSYQTAAQSIRSLPERVEDLSAQGHDLSEIQSIGESLAGKIHEILDTGTCKKLEELRKKFPRGLPELIRVPGLGPRKAMRLYEELQIENIKDLKKACENHKVRELKGMGAKTEEKILHGLGLAERSAGRILYQEAAEILKSMAAYLDKQASINRWEVAGSFRRGRETIGDLDILINARDRKKATDAILGYSAIDKVLSRGKERISIQLAGSLQIDFRFFDTPAFGAALVYFTGSKDHNIKIRRIAQDKKWKLNEYGLFKGDRRLAGQTEKDLYERLGLNWVPPELREDRGEVEAAANGRLPALIEPGDVHGDFQCHTTASDGKNSIREMADAAQKYGFDFLAITDHSKRVTMAHGMDDDRARKHADAIREVNNGMKSFWLLAGIEVDILKSGKLDLKESTLESLDWVVASVHYDRNMSKKAMTDRILAAIKSGAVHCLGHPLGRLIGKRDPIEVDMDRIIEACIEHNVRLEINCQPERLDLPDIYCRSARDAGVGFTLGTDSHSVDGFRFMPLGVTVARRGWLRKKDVLNTRTIAELKKELKRR